MPAYGIESRKGQAMDAKASHNNLKHLKNAVVREAPPVSAPTGAGAGAGAVAGAGMETLLNTGTYTGAGPAVVDAEAGSITSALKERLLDYGLEPTDLPKVRRRVRRVWRVWRTWSAWRVRSGSTFGRM